MSTASTSYSLSAVAYALPILHAAQHPSSTTTGLFLAPSPSSSSSSVEVTDAVPLQHVNTTLSPYTELGLEMASKYAEGRGLQIVGMYIAHESDTGTGLGRTGERILAKLKESFAGVFALVLDNDRLGAGKAAYTVYLASSPAKPLPNTADSLPSPFTLDASIPAKTLKAIREGKAHRGIKDLDDHLEDSSSDWLENKETKQALQRYLA